MRLTLRYAVQSERGLRSNNEDAAFASPRLLALADGMGGHAGGEVAASLAIREVIRLNDEPPRGDLLRGLHDAIERANDAIATRAESDPDLAGMGTTLTAMLFDGPRVALVHVGDSRAYLLRNGRLTQLTKDDTFVQSLVDEGRITAAEAWRHPQSSIVTQVLTGARVDPHFEVREVDAGDRYLICSDGLSDYVTERDIAETLYISDPIRCPQELIRRALQHGSQDNITCIVADVTERASGYNIALLTGAPGTAATVVRV